MDGNSTPPEAAQIPPEFLKALAEAKAGEVGQAHGEQSAVPPVAESLTPHEPEMSMDVPLNLRESAPEPAVKHEDEQALRATQEEEMRQMEAAQQALLSAAAQSKAENPLPPSTKPITVEPQKRSILGMLFQKLKDFFSAIGRFFGFGRQKMTAGV